MSETSSMIGRRAALLGFTAIGLFPAARAFAGGKDASPWSHSMHSALRLISGGGRNGHYLAGIALSLKSGFKTYWRQPGNSGVPPVFRFEGSGNLASAHVHFPAPQRFDDGAGGFSFGYLEPELILPVSIVASDPAKPVRLKLHADYAVCEKLCFPATGSVELELSASGTRGFADAIYKAMALVPRKAVLGEGGALQVTGLRRGDGAGSFLVDVRSPGTDRPELFIEADQPWFLEAKAFIPATDGKPAHFAVQVIERDKSPHSSGADLTLTLVMGKQAIEVRTRLDIALITP